MMSVADSKTNRESDGNSSPRFIPDISLRFVENRDTLTLPLSGKAQNETADSFFSVPYHAVEPRPACRISVQNQSDRNRVVRLSVAEPVGLPDTAARFVVEWVQWRPPAEATGAVDTPVDRESIQSGVDSLSPDGRVLQLLVNANARREIALEFLPHCQSGHAGEYLFAVVGEEVAQTVREKEAERIALRPLIGRLILTCPESDLLALLPGVYQEAARTESQKSADGGPSFGERFLLGFEEMNDAFDAQMSELPRLFGADTAPPEWLRWLATWVGLTLDDRWPEMRRRELIRHAIPLYRRRGTVSGLSDYLELFTGIRPQISDQPVDGMRLGQSARLGSPAARIGHIAAHTFVVTFAPGGNPSETVGNRMESPVLSDGLTIATLHDIILSNKPAHTAYELRVVEGAMPALEQKSADMPTEIVNTGEIAPAESENGLNNNANGAEDSEK